MAKRILVAYATGSGSTREIAETIGATLRAAALEVDLKAVQEVELLTDYSALVIGSSVRSGRWLPEAVDFVRDFAADLATHPVAYFTTCLTLMEDTTENRRRALAYVEPILALAPAVNLADIGLFAGSLDPTLHVDIPGVDGPHGDYRDWEAIRAWAAALPPMLAASAPVASLLEIDAEIDVEIDVDSERGIEPTATGAEADVAPLYWEEMADADLTDANLTSRNLIGADLSGADLSGANLAGAILNGSTLAGTQLRGADLSEADLHWANLAGADLRDANLQLAMLGWANLTGADLTGATLSLARYNEYTRWPEGFSPEEAGCRFTGGTR